LWLLSNAQGTGASEEVIVYKQSCWYPLWSRQE
jgi:hypothetical protein